MATLAPLQPRSILGALDPLRSKRLLSAKNIQNGQFIARQAISALPAHMSFPSKPISSPLKRRYEPDRDSDEENVDPSLLASPAKKSKSGYEVRSKVSQCVLTAAKTTPEARIMNTLRSPAVRLTGTRKPIRGKSPNRSNTVSTKATAGKSFKKGAKGIGSMHRNTTRNNPATDAVGGLSFSIADALAATVNKGNVSEEAMLGKSAKGLIFEIHEDTQDQEMGNLIEHSTCTLDISDDESRAAAIFDVGKENIPPPDHMGNYNTAYVPVSRKNLMTDEPRKPLGNLDAVEYYGEGCDKDSFIWIDEDDEVQCFTTSCDSSSSYQTPSNPVVESDHPWKELCQQLATEKGMTIAAGGAVYAPVAKQAPIDIWESESAKDDDATAQDGSDTITPSVAIPNPESIQDGLAIQQ